MNTSRQIHADLFEKFGGWSDLDPWSLHADAMRQFIGQNPHRVASFINACDVRRLQLLDNDIMESEHASTVEASSGCGSDILRELDLLYEVEELYGHTP